jgi:DNA polymerase V
MDLRKRGEFTDDLFAQCQSQAAEKVMSVLDEINQRWGSGTLRAASVPTTPDWGMRREMISQSFTTRLDQLWTVKCN